MPQWPIESPKGVTLYQNDCWNVVINSRYLQAGQKPITFGHKQHLKKKKSNRKNRKFFLTFFNVTSEEGKNDPRFVANIVMVFCFFRFSRFWSFDFEFFPPETHCCWWFSEAKLKFWGYKILVKTKLNTFFSNTNNFFEMSTTNSSQKSTYLFNFFNSKHLFLYRISSKWELWFVYFSAFVELRTSFGAVLRYRSEKRKT